MDSLQSLLSSRAALDLGLIHPEDFEAVKQAFLSAQKVKTGFDAGLLTVEDFEAAKRDFINSVLAGGGETPRENGAPLKSARSQGDGTTGAAAAGVSDTNLPGANGASAATTPAKPPLSARPLPGGAASPGGRSAAGPANPEVPTNIPKLGGTQSRPSTQVCMRDKGRGGEQRAVPQYTH
jgi:cofilin